MHNATEHYQKSMNYLKYLLIFLIGACQRTDGNRPPIYEMDTITIKLGDQHAHPTPKGQNSIIVKDQNGEPLTSLYADSTYFVTVEHRSDVRVKLYEKTSNFKLTASQGHYYLTTQHVEPGSREKVQIGFLTDQSRNILIYHHKYLDPNDSTKFIETRTQVDTIGYTALTLHGRGPS